MGLTYFIVHASCFSAKDSKRGVCRTQKACRSSYNLVSTRSLHYLSQPIEKRTAAIEFLWWGGRVGYDTYFGGFSFLLVSSIATKPVLHATIPLNIFFSHITFNSTLQASHPRHGFGACLILCTIKRYILQYHNVPLEHSYNIIHSHAMNSYPHRRQMS